MSDAILSDPVHERPAASLVLPAPGSCIMGAEAKLSLAGGLSRWSLRARDAGLLARATGLTLPQRIGDTVGGVAKLGPDEWYALLPDTALLVNAEGAGGEGAVSVVDVSARSVGIRIEGQGAGAALMSGCPLDLHAMADGRATRTLYETADIILLRESATRYHIEVWRSFAPWLWACLAAAIG